MRSLSLSCVLALGACHATATTTTPTAARPAGPQPLHKGDTVDGLLHLGEVHVFAIALAGGEPLHLDITSTRGAPPCGNWTWSWHAPEGATITGNPLDIPDGTPSHTTPLDLAAKIADTGDMVPLAGTYTFQLEADPANCQEIRYRLSAR